MDTLLQKLISIPSVCGDFAAAREVINFTSSYLDSRGMHIRHFEQQGFPSLVATTRPGVMRPAVMLAAHLDVVPASKRLFNLRLENGRYSGRGVFDMKFAAASYLHLVDKLQGSLEEYDFGIMLTTDEELYGSYGTGYLVEQGYIPGVVVLPDGASDWDIETQAKGRWFVELTVTGRAAHGSRPWEGDSASVKMIRLLHDLLEPYQHGDLPSEKTVNVGMIECGEMANQVPEIATVKLDFRYSTPEQFNETLTHLTLLCEKYTASYVSLSDTAQPISNRLDNPKVAAFADCITQVTGITPRAINSHGASDARFFGAKGVPCVVTSPSGGGRHSDTEWLDEVEYAQLTPILRLYVERVARRVAPELLVSEGALR